MSSQSIHRRIIELEAQMAAAAASDDFERAARLRDQIADLKGPAVRKPPPGQMGLGTNIHLAARPHWGRAVLSDPSRSLTYLRGARTGTRLPEDYGLRP